MGQRRVVQADQEVPPWFLAVAVGGYGGSSHRLGWCGGRGRGLQHVQTILPAQAIICTSCSPLRGNSLDKDSVGVPAGARGLCIQVLAPRSKAH